MNAKLLFALATLLCCLSSCDQSAKKLSKEALFAPVFEYSTYEGDSIGIECLLNFVFFKQDFHVLSSGDVSLDGKGDCFYYVPGVTDPQGHPYKDQTGKNAKAFMQQECKLHAVGKWSLDGNRLSIEWNLDSTQVLKVDKAVCKNIGFDIATPFYESNKELLGKYSLILQSTFVQMYKEYLSKRTQFTYNAEKGELSATIDGKEDVVMCTLKFKDEQK